MTTPTLRKTLCTLPLAAVLALTACGGGGGGTGTAGTGSHDSTDGNAPGGGSATGTLTLGVTDMPVDSALEVNVVFTGVTLKPAGEDSTPLTFACDDPGFDCGGTGERSIDLLTLTGDDSEKLLDAVTVPAGEYEWIRLQVDAAGPAPGSDGASNIVLDSTQGPEVLAIPSGAQSGLKLVKGFTVPTGSSASFTIDFDLRRAVVELGRPHTPRFLLKPALRLVDNRAAGTLAGTFEPGQYAQGCSDPGDAAVYVYEGGQAATGDIGSDAEPLASVAIADDDGDGVTEPGDSDGIFAFEVGFLDADPDYTVAVTCEASGDTDAGGEPIGFADVVNDVAISAGATTTVTFDGGS